MSKAVVAKVVRAAFILCVSMLGGVAGVITFKAIYSGNAAAPLLWLPFFAGVVLANFLVNWWSHRFPPRHTDEWRQKRPNP